MSWKPDPGALHVDAFKVPLSDFKCYGFAPFSLIDRVLQKLQVDKAEQRRDIYTSSLANTAMVSPSDKSVCVMPGKVTTCHRSPDLTICTGQNPSIISKTTTITCHLSGKFIDGQAYQTRQFPSL